MLRDIVVCWPLNVASNDNLCANNLSAKANLSYNLAVRNRHEFIDGHPAKDSD